MQGSAVDFSAQIASSSLPFAPKGFSFKSHYSVIISAFGG
jgi:hypothetical protein